MPGFFNDMMLMDRCSSATATSNGGGGGLGDARAFQLALELSMLGIGDPLLSNGTANTSSSSTSATSNNNGIIITNGNNTNSNSSSNHLHNNGSNNSNGHLHNHHHHHHHLHHLSDDQQLQHQQQQPDSPTTVNDLGSFVLGGNGCGLGPLGLVDEVRSKKSQNMTECVPVPSSEHVAEIVGRQGCKIKALRAKTNTYIKTPVRGEEPVFVVTGRKEDVAKAKREILSAAEHFSQIRASRKNNNLAGLMNGCGGAGAGGGLTGLSGLNGGCGGSGASTPPGPAALNNAVNQNVPGHVTIQVRVPYRVVGLVVGPKGATIKRIQHQTHTYIVTPSRDKEPVFEVTGLPESVETARREIEAHIAMRTGATSTTSGNGVGASGGGGGIGSSSSSFNCLNASSSSSMMGSNAIVSSAFGANCFGGGCLDDATSDILASLCKTGLNSLFNYIEPSSNGGGSNAIAMSGVSMLTSECDANQSDSVVSFPLMMTSSSASTSSSSSSSSSSGIGYPSNGSNSTSGAFFSGSSSSSCSSSSGGGSGGGGRNGDLGAIWSSALTNDRDEGLGDSPSFDTAAVTAAAIMMSTVSATSSSSSSTNGNHGGASTNNNIWSYPSSSSPSSSSASSASSSSTATASSSSAIIVAPPSSSLSPNSGSPIDSLLGNSGGGAAGAPVAKCLVCVEAKVTHALVPCGHNFFCMDCARRVCDNGGNNGGGNGNGGESQCPVCSLPALQAIRIYSPNP